VFGDAGQIAKRAVGFQHRLLRGADPLDLKVVIHHPQAGKAGLVRRATDLGQARAERGGATGPGKAGDL